MPAVDDGSLAIEGYFDVGVSASAASVELVRTAYLQLARTSELDLLNLGCVGLLRKPEESRSLVRYRHRGDHRLEDLVSIIRLSRCRTGRERRDEQRHHTGAGSYSRDHRSFSSVGHAAFFLPFDRVHNQFGPLSANGLRPRRGPPVRHLFLADTSMHRRASPPVSAGTMGSFSAPMRPRRRWAVLDDPRPRRRSTTHATPRRARLPAPRSRHRSRRVQSTSMVRALPQSRTTPLPHHQVSPTLPSSALPAR